MLFRDQGSGCDTYSPSSLLPAHHCLAGSGGSLLTIEQGSGLLDGLWNLLQAMFGCALQVRGRDGAGASAWGTEHTFSR